MIGAAVRQAHNLIVVYLNFEGGLEAGSANCASSQKEQKEDATHPSQAIAHVAPV
jgi:hypothetical protein